MERQLAQGTILEERYEIIDLIGRGGMGVVYTATHLQLKRKVAIKILHPAEADNEGMIKRFKIEARSAANVHHPHIVGVMDYGVTPDGRPFFVMEYLIGESLGDKLDREAKLPERDIVEITEQMLIGLMVAHRAGIVHRDIKPENIFLTLVEGKRDLVKILDFGISKILVGTTSRPPPSITEGHSRLTQAGVVLGTPGYMAPESLFSDTEVDARADLFSVGVLMFEMLTGRQPFRGSDPHKAMIATASKPVPSIKYLRPESSKAMQRLITTALAKNPDDRFQTAKEFLEQLSSAAVGRVGDDARPCRTRTVAPSIIPDAPSMNNQMMPNSLETEARNEFQRPPARTSPNQRTLIENSKLPDAIYPIRDSDVPSTRSRTRSRRKPFSLWISPFYVLVIAGIGVSGYYLLHTENKIVVEETYIDPIDAKIASLNAKGRQGTTGTSVEHQKTHIRPDGTIVPASISVWLETSHNKLEVTVGDQILFERPLIIPGHLEPIKLKFSAPGYQDKIIEITPDREQTLEVKLKKNKKH